MYPQNTTHSCLLSCTSPERFSYSPPFTQMKWGIPVGTPLDDKESVTHLSSCNTTHKRETPGTNPEALFCSTYAAESGLCLQAAKQCRYVQPSNRLVVDTHCNYQTALVPRQFLMWCLPTPQQLELLAYSGTLLAKSCPKMK